MKKSAGGCNITFTVSLSVIDLYYPSLSPESRIPSKSSPFRSEIEINGLYDMPITPRGETRDTPPTNICPAIGTAITIFSLIPIQGFKPTQGSSWRGRRTNVSSRIESSLIVLTMSLFMAYLATELVLRGV